MTGADIIPQVFVGRHNIGGATETSDAFNSGELRRRAGALGMTMDPGALRDAYGFLPAWPHPR